MRRHLPHRRSSNCRSVQPCVLFDVERTNSHLHEFVPSCFRDRGAARRVQRTQQRWWGPRLPASLVMLGGGSRAFAADVEFVRPRTSESAGGSLGVVRAAGVRMRFDSRGDLAFGRAYVCRVYDGNSQLTTERFRRPAHSPPWDLRRRVRPSCQEQLVQ